MAKARALNSESGFAIIEVVVSAAVLAIVALAVLSGIDGATGSSGREKARAVASSLAEQDQERLRAMSLVDLKALIATPGSNAYAVDGVDYKVTSNARWVTDDSGGTPACGNSSNNAEYFHITSTVTSSAVGTAGRIPAVKIDSLVSPTVAYSQGHGTLGVKVVDRNGKGVKGVFVTAAGLATGSTDQDGCYVWRSIDVGTYNVSLNTSGMCDPAGETLVNRDQTVSPNTVAFANFTYDTCARADITVKTHTPGTLFSATTNKQASKARELTDVSTGGVKTWPSTGTTPISITNLFPFPTTSYGFFTGQCTYQSPEKLGLSNYFTNTNSAASVLADPLVPKAATVYQPPVYLRVIRGATSGSPTAGQVEVHMSVIKPTAFNSDTCADEEFVMKTANWPSGWTPVPGNTAGWVSQDKTTFDPGMPFGTYSIDCLYDTVARKGVKVTGTTYDNKSVDGLQTAQTINVTTGWLSSVTC